MFPTDTSYFSPQEPDKSIYKFLTAQERADLENHLVRTQVMRDDLIYKEGDRPLGFITLEEGKVKIFKEGVGGREQILRMVKPGGFVSYRALLAGEDHLASAVALEDSLITIIDSDYFFNRLLKIHALTGRLLNKLAKELGFSNSRTVTLTQKHIRGRLAESIVLLKDKYGVEPDGTLKAYLTREDLANLSNMTASNAIRTLSTFISERVIAIDGRKIKILDPQKLERISLLG
jgi:CRP/FNR family transcriptional regulator, polysaccharide utilization system transcription regulator